MIIGLTYDLRSDYLKEGYSEEQTAEFDNEQTILAIESALHKLGIQTERIGNAKHLMHKLLQGKKWDLVFNICEGMYGDSRESLVPALLDAFQIKFVFSDAITLGISLNKALTKKIIRDAGINTAPFFEVNNINEIKNCNLNYPLFAKPVAEGTGKGIEDKSVIYDYTQLFERCNYILNTFKQAVIVEEFLPGREFTVGITGNGDEAIIEGVMEVIYGEGVNNIYSYFNKENYKNRITYKKVDKEIFADCANISLKVWKTLNAHDGGRIDLRIDKQGKMSFIEINPLAGLNPISSDLPILCKMYGTDYDTLIKNIMNAALKRNNISY